MTLRYLVLDDAARELVEAAAYHEEQRAGLGSKVLAEYDAVVGHARAFPTPGSP